MKDDKSKGMKKGRGIPGLDVIKLLGAIPALIITLIGAISFKLFSSLLRKISKIETLKLTLIIFLFFISIFSLVIAGYLTLLQGIIILTMIFLLSLLPPMFHLAAHIHEFYESLPISDFFARKSSVLLIIPILFILIIVGNATLHYTESPEFCVTCHLMTPYYISYQSSQHKEVESCLDCHYEPGVIGHVKGKLGGMVSMVRYISGMYTLPIESNISSDLCLRCHDEYGIVNMSGVYFSHKNHEKDDCNECHGVHGGAGGEIQDHDQAQPTGHGVPQPNNQPIKMKTCVYCHGENDVELNKTKCWACHIADYDPNSVAGCVQCHGDMLDDTISVEDVNFTHKHMGDRLSCTSCHRGEFHEGYYTDNVRPYCMTCHSVIKKNIFENSSLTTTPSRFKPI